jgi:hypothetical protein
VTNCSGRIEADPEAVIGEIVAIGEVGRTPDATDLIVKTDPAAIGRIASIALRKQIVQTALTGSNVMIK